MTDQDIYNIAEWITYNSEDLYSIFISSDINVDPETFLYYRAIDYFGKQYTPEDLNIAFDVFFSLNQLWESW